MAHKIIVANWKMNPISLEEAKKLFQGIQKTAKELKRTKAVVCPPFVFLESLAKKQKTIKCALGSQDVFWKREGAFTGEISPRQLERMGVSYVIIGHSERRALGETDEEVSKKARAALAEGLTPIICIGEKERDKEGEYLSFLRDELRHSLSGISKKDAAKLIIAYEPVWAVGADAKRADTPDSFFETVIFIRKTLVKIFGWRSKKEIMKIPILYGGSVDEDNAGGFLREGNAAGLLVGRASLDAKKFGEILKIADKIQ